MVQKNTGRGTASFGKRRERPRITITRGGKVHSFSVRPWITISLATFCLAFLVTYLAATGYLIMRDDLINATVARRAQMQFAYEDRIADLRASIDRITSRQLLKTDSFDAKIERIIKRQDEITGRQAAVSGILEAARKQGINVALAKPKRRPSNKSSDRTEASRTSSDTGASEKSTLLDTSEPRKTGAFLDSLRTRLDTTGVSQAAVLDAITISAESSAEKIAKLARSLGARLDAARRPGKARNIGGPYEPLVDSTQFNNRIRRAEMALKRFSSYRQAIRRQPIGRPLSGAIRVASRYGARVDPFLGRPAMHTGVDLKAAYGTRVMATAPGRVVKAGRHGGYGNVVEIRHAGGIATRYAHLSRILVTVGQTVRAGQAVGKVGSTGRSTGPHLHYETRRHDKATNPMVFLTAATRLKALLN